MAQEGDDSRSGDDNGNGVVLLVLLWCWCDNVGADSMAMEMRRPGSDWGLVRLWRKDSGNDDDGLEGRDGEAGVGCVPDNGGPRPLQISVLFSLPSSSACDATEPSAALPHNLNI